MEKKEIVERGFAVLAAFCSIAIMITFAIVSILETELTTVGPIGAIWWAIAVFLWIAYIVKDRRETELINELKKTKRALKIATKD